MLTKRKLVIEAVKFYGLWAIHILVLVGLFMVLAKLMNISFVETVAHAFVGKTSWDMTREFLKNET